VYRLIAAISVLGAVLLLGNGLPGQDKKDEKKPAPLRGVLPPNWGHLGLSDEQKQKVFKIEADARVKILELEKQISELKERRYAAMQSVLTEEQKKKLKLVNDGKDVEEKKP
jgi:Spy/CpxP family protein refolding chaperone